jgi:sporulation protein YlmC with PRC-barrel domain
VELSPRHPTSELIGRRVYDQSGRALGRVYELRGRWEGDEVVIEELLVGRGALLKRLRGPGPDARGISCAAVAEVSPERIVVSV